MKFVSTILCFSYLVIAIIAIPEVEMTKNEKMMMAKMTMTACKESEMATDEDFEVLMKGESNPDTRTGRCMMACIVEKMGPVSFWRISFSII